MARLASNSDALVLISRETLLRFLLLMLQERRLTLMTRSETAGTWTVEDGADLYDLNRWGDSYFSTNSRGPHHHAALDLGYRLLI